MATEQRMALIVFDLTGSFTPEPSNTMAIATAATYANGEPTAQRLAIACAVFSAACRVSLLTWAALGSTLQRRLPEGACDGAGSTCL